jgi:hypothetical protein
MQLLQTCCTFLVHRPASSIARILEHPLHLQQPLTEKAMPAWMHTLLASFTVRVPGLKRLVQARM